jgi:hypothetical protein
VRETPLDDRRHSEQWRPTPVLLDRDYYSLDEILETEVHLRCLFRERIQGMASLDASGNAAFAARAEASVIGCGVERAGGVQEAALQLDASDNTSMTPGLLDDSRERVPRNWLSKDRADILTAAAAAAHNATHHMHRNNVAAEPVGAGAKLASPETARPTTDALDMLPQVVCDLPVWLAEMLAARMFVHVELPRSLGQKLQRELRADARVVNLAEKSFHFYAVARRFQRFFQMNRGAGRKALNRGNAALTELGPVLIRAFQDRCLDILDRAQNLDHTDPLEQIRKLESSEREMFTSIHRAALLYAQWKRGEHRRLRACSPLVPCWHTVALQSSQHRKRSSPPEATSDNYPRARASWRVPLSTRNIEDDLVHCSGLAASDQTSPRGTEKPTAAHDDTVATAVAITQPEDADKENEGGAIADVSNEASRDTEPISQRETSPEDTAIDAELSRKASPELSNPNVSQTKRRRRMLLLGESRASCSLHEQV